MKNGVNTHPLCAPLEETSAVHCANETLTTISQSAVKCRARSLTLVRWLQIVDML